MKAFNPEIFQKNFELDKYVLHGVFEDAIRSYSNIIISFLPYDISQTPSTYPLSSLLFALSCCRYGPLRTLCIIGPPLKTCFGPFSDALTLPNNERYSKGWV